MTPSHGHNEERPDEHAALPDAVAQSSKGSDVDDDEDRVPTRKRKRQQARKSRPGTDKAVTAASRKAERNEKALRKETAKQLRRLEKQESMEIAKRERRERQLSQRYERISEKDEEDVGALGTNRTVHSHGLRCWWLRWTLQ